jgi:GNAT superfamily N-acetyltransferase
MRKTTVEYTIAKATSDEKQNKIREFVQRFRGEQEQWTFDKNFMVAELPAYAANAEGNLVGFVSFAKANSAVIIVALGVLPRYQRLGIGKNLIEKVEAEAKKLKKKVAGFNLK